MAMTDRKRTPEQIIGKDRINQLIFEGYEVVPAHIGDECTRDLVAALEPFGRVPLVCTEGIDDSATVFEFEGGEITLGDLRRVHSTLSRAKGKSVEPIAFTGGE